MKSNFERAATEEIQPQSPQRMRRKRSISAHSAVCAVALCSPLLVVLGLGLAASSASAQVTSDRLVNASAEPQQWLMYSGAYDGSRFTPLDQINKTNVQRLSL